MVGGVSAGHLAGLGRHTVRAGVVVDVEAWEALDVFLAKAPVCLCDQRPCQLGSDMCGPQRKALRARRHIEAAGITLPDGLSAALSHAFTGEGRGEFDSLTIKLNWALLVD